MITVCEGAADDDVREADGLEGKVSDVPAS